MITFEPTSVWLTDVRCSGRPPDLDSESIPRTKEWTQFLVHHFDHDILWSEYGTISYVTVSVVYKITCTNNHPCASIQPFTHHFPQADIYELLSPDLLHQIIKGVFKDHLVLWVEKYLIAVYGRKGAKQRLSDIDQRFGRFTLTLKYHNTNYFPNKQDCIVPTIPRVTAFQNRPQLQAMDWQ